MKRALPLLALALLALPVASLALPQRTFVSAQTGNDANPCSVLSPCRGFAAAVAAVAAGGEVVALDSGGYGPVTLTKAVTIVCPPGIYAGVFVMSGDGIGVSAGSSDVVTLRNLTLNSTGSGNGINFMTGKDLHVENCKVSNWGTGIYQTGGNLFVDDTVVKGCNDGIVPSGAVAATIARTKIEDCGIAVIPQVGANVRATNSVASGNSFGFYTSGSVSPTTMSLEGCLAFGNSNNGMVASAFGGQTARLYVANSTSTGNGVGLGQNLNGGAETVQTLGNNLVVNNGMDIAGTVTVIPAH